MLCPSLTWKPPRTTCYRSTLHQQPWPRAKVVFGLQREYSHHPTPPTAALALHPLPTAHNLDTTISITNTLNPLLLLVTYQTPLHDLINTTLNNIKTIGTVQLPPCLVRVWTPSSFRPRVHNAPLIHLAITRRATKTVQVQVRAAPVDPSFRGAGVGKRLSLSKLRNQSLIEGSREGKLVLLLPNGNRCLRPVVAPPQALGVARGDERRSSQKHVTGVLIHIDLLDRFFQYTFPPTTIILALTLTCDVCVNVSLS